jgi:hypothetical protein
MRRWPLVLLVHLSSLALAQAPAPAPSTPPATDTRRLNISDQETLTLMEKTVIELPISASTTKETIGKYVDKLDERCSLEFFDFFHPQISDPGAYVSVHMEKGKLTYMLGNHGWTSAWKPTTRKALIDSIYKNRAHNDGKIRLEARSNEHREVKTGEKTTYTVTYHNIDDKQEKPAKK